MNHSLYGGLSSCCLEWRVEARSEQLLQISADFEFPDSYAGFLGHFPDNPILPAIVQLAAVRYLCEAALGRDLTPKHYRKIKFKGIIRPNDRVAVAVDLSESKAGWQGHFTLSRMALEVAASGSVEFLKNL